MRCDGRALFETKPRPSSASNVHWPLELSPRRGRTSSRRRMCAGIICCGIRMFHVGLRSWWWLLLLLLVVQPSLGVPDPPDEDLSGRGDKKFGDECKEDRDCGFAGSYCKPDRRICVCREEFEATNQIDKCGPLANVNESCFFREQCEQKVSKTECRDGRCTCIFEKIPSTRADGVIECIDEIKEPPNLRYVDPAMIGVLVGMALMFIIICVVLRLFSKARWRENRTIFNTPNARLMNVSLLRDNKLLHAQEQRRGSRASVRGPSRQPSMVSLRAHSPNASQGSRTGSRRGSRGSSGNASAVSTKSNKSPPHHTANAGDPTVEQNVTIEVLEAKA